MSHFYGNKPTDKITLPLRRITEVLDVKYVLLSYCLKRRNKGNSCCNLQETGTMLELLIFQRCILLTWGRRLFVILSKITLQFIENCFLTGNSMIFLNKPIN